MGAEQVISWYREPKVRAWLERLAAAGCRVRKLRAERIIRKRGGEMLFAMVRGDIADPSGQRLPPIALVRGDAVVVVPLLRNRRTGEERFLTVLQRRIGNGQLNVEFPAGMLDRNTGDPAIVAVRELYEETGLSVTTDQLQLLWDRPLYTSVGLLDEAIWFYGGILHVGDRRFRALDGERHGARNEGEHITTALRTAVQIEREALSLPVLMGLKLFQRWRSGPTGM